MKRALLLTALLGSGCFCRRTPEPLPVVWIVPEVKLRLEWDAAPDDPLLSRVRELAFAMNRRLYDLSDGQIRIARFTVHLRWQFPAETPGTANLYRPEDSCPTCFDHASAQGRPNGPSWFHASLHEDLGDLERRSIAMAHEWLHAWTGLLDEYRETDASKKAKCPESLIERLRKSACLMYRTNDYTELCRAENHNADTHQGQERGMSCYEWLVKACRDAGVGELRIPDGPVPGPEDPPAPEFVVGF